MSDFVLELVKILILDLMELIQSSTHRTVKLGSRKGERPGFRTDANNDLFVTDRLDCEKLEVRGGKIKSDSGDNEFEFYPEGRSENDHPIFQIFNRTSPGINLPLNNSVKDMSNLKEFGRTPHLVDLMLELPNLVN